MFDAYGNHVVKGLEVQLDLLGLQILDQLGLKRKVRFFIYFLVWWFDMKQKIVTKPD